MLKTLPSFQELGLTTFLKTDPDRKGWCMFLRGMDYKTKRKKNLPPDKLRVCLVLSPSLTNTFFEKKEINGESGKDFCRDRQHACARRMFSH